MADDEVRNFSLDAHGLMAFLRSWVFGTKEVRLQQAANAAGIVKEANTTVDGTAVFTVPGTDNMQQAFSTLIIVTDETSGKGRYLTSGRLPTAAGAGIPLPTGGAFAVITGNDQIRKFAVIAETGQTLNLWWGLFQ
jgi:hypothetical protein